MKHACTTLALLVLVSPPAGAQDRPFVFTLATGDATTRSLVVHYDLGYGDRAFEVRDENGLQQRLGVQATVGRGWTLIARVGMAASRDDTRSTQQGELLYNVLNQPSQGVTVAVGGGLRHEAAGVDVLLGRIAAGRRFAASRLEGNVAFEKPLEQERDALDVITTIGWSLRVADRLAVGVEAVGEDLEGFWTEDEAEGGAKFLVGPAVRIAERRRRWQLTIGGGPILRATRSIKTSQAARALEASGARNGFAVRTSFAYVF